MIRNLFLPNKIYNTKRSGELPLELDEVKKYMNIDSNHDDSKIIALIYRVVDLCESYTLTAIAEQQWMQSYYRPMESNQLELFIVPTVSIVQCILVNHNNNKTLFANEHISFIEDNIITFNPLPIYSKAIMIEYRSGRLAHGALEESLKSILCSHILHLYDFPQQEFDMRVYDPYRNIFLEMR